MRKKQKRGPVLILAFLWLVFLLLVAGVFYLSLQNGEDAKEMGKNLINYTAEKRHPGQELSEEYMLEFTYKFRQLGRVAIFFAIGFLGTLILHLTFYRWNWFMKTVLAGGLVGSIAYLTEKLKIYIPSRHFSLEEMWFSLLAVGAGFLVVSAWTLIYYILKGSFMMIADLFTGKKPN